MSRMREKERYLEQVNTEIGYYCKTFTTGISQNILQTKEKGLRRK